jgi:hypothetical protein
VRFLGLSEAGPDTIRHAHAVQPVSVLRTVYAIFERAVESPRTTCAAGTSAGSRQLRKEHRLRRGRVHPAPVDDYL